MEPRRLASDPRGLCGGKIAECQPQLGQQKHKILVTEPAEQFVDSLQLYGIREQQIPGGKKQSLQKGRGLKLLIPGAPEVSGRGSDCQISLFRCAPVEKPQRCSVERGMDGLLPDQFLQRL